MCVRFTRNVCGVGVQTQLVDPWLRNVGYLHRAFNALRRTESDSRALFVAPTRGAAYGPAVQVAASEFGTCALDTEGHIWCWGYIGRCAELTCQKASKAVGTTQKKLGAPCMPMPVDPVVRARQIAIASGILCAVTLDRGLVCGSPEMRLEGGECQIGWTPVRNGSICVKDCDHQTGGFRAHYRVRGIQSQA